MRPPAGDLSMDDLEKRKVMLAAMEEILDSREYFDGNDALNYFEGELQKIGLRIGPVER